MINTNDADDNYCIFADMWYNIYEQYNTYV